MEFTGERLTTEVKGKIAIEHLHRYAITLSWLTGKDVLDLASGEGYGSNLMATVARHVTGVDASHEAVAHASRQYKRTNLTFVQGLANKIPLGDHSVDIVVSFETIEHLTEHDEMMLEIKRVLRQPGTLIISSPDKRFYSDVPSHRNDYHVKELYQDEFEALIRKHFRHSEFYAQGFVVGSLINRTQPQPGIEQYSGDFHKVDHLKKVDHLYNLAICSDTPITTTFSNSIFNDEKLFNAIEEYYAKRIDSIYRSKSYRFGNFFVEIYRTMIGKK